MNNLLAPKRAPAPKRARAPAATTTARKSVAQAVANDDAGAGDDEDDAESVVNLPEEVVSTTLVAPARLSCPACRGRKRAHTCGRARTYTKAARTIQQQPPTLPTLQLVGVDPPGAGEPSL